MLQLEELTYLQNQSAEIIKDVGEYIANNFQLDNKITYKDSRDFFTKIDIEAEKRLKSELHKLLPEAGFILEEGQSIIKSKLNWTIDPLDQTKNYATRLPLFFTQVALLENNIPILGHIYEPLSRQLFSASIGNGASLNSNILSCNQDRTINKAIINLDITGKTSLNFQKSLISELITKVYRLRISPAYTIFIATGAIDGFIGIYTNDKFIDLAPRLIIINESGFNTEYFEYNNLKFFVAGNKNIFPQLKKILDDNKKYM